MEKLNEIVRCYLTENGIRNDFFADYIGCDHPKCTRWLQGKCKLNTEQVKRVHEFLAGNHIKKVEDVVKG